MIENNIYFSNLLIIIEDHPVVLSHTLLSPFPLLAFLTSLLHHSLSLSPYLLPFFPIYKTAFTLSIIPSCIKYRTASYLLHPSPIKLIFNPLLSLFFFYSTVTGANQIETADGKITKLEKLSAHERAGRARLLGK